MFLGKVFPLIKDKNVISYPGLANVLFIILQNLRKVDSDITLNKNEYDCSKSMGLYLLFSDVCGCHC